MKELELNISKVLLDSITLDEFENNIYQEFYVDQISTNSFIYKVITINYKGKCWKKELEKLIYELWGEKKYLTYSLYKYCLKITQTDNSESIFNIVDKISELNVEYDYEYKTLMQFYSYSDELGLILSGYGSYSIEKLIINIKTYAKQYLSTYNLDTDISLLLNLEEDLNKTDNRIEKLVNKKAQSNFLKKEKTNYKWFLFWKSNKREDS
ncbi:hypothetical protein D1818_18500 [Aquimarina sp. BL5]|uniref:hypothetical protein n=1 Tax=Aquimarina sp. BL5 TaxID=1714860 RepID=UPI000E47E68B|nr:hypothetical protein [Aquimarina sp. BL5]AXT52717.1 hypothetical protein D1818_18500 [Aquimarina sp. BL5]RKN08302.1 hypothetical protein D7036_06110 [Aquimarina sp. BL5]